VLWLFHHESTYRKMLSNVAHIGQAVFLKPDAARENPARSGWR